MPNQLTIQNHSHSVSVVVSLEPILIPSKSNDYGDTFHLQDKKIAPTESIKIIVKGGVKKLTVAKDEGAIFWQGIIPSYGNSPVVIFPEKAAVKYNDLFMVNVVDIIHDELDSLEGISTCKKYTYMALALAIIGLMIWYIKRK